MDYKRLWTIDYILYYVSTVSYTHLDVYKRQVTVHNILYPLLSVQWAKSHLTVDVATEKSKMIKVLILIDIEWIVYCYVSTVFLLTTCCLHIVFTNFPKDISLF